jgi:restriction system protein
MAVPEFHTFMLPLLKLAADGREHRMLEAEEALAQEFQISAADRAETLPSGRQTRFANRVGWARTYLRKAGLLDYPSRGTFRITELGRAALAENPSAITIAYLSKYAGFNEFKRAGTTGGNPIGETADALTPVEALEAGYQQLRASLAGELLDQVKSRSPDFFENLVVDLLVRMGYGGSRKEAGERIGKSGDGASTASSRRTSWA